ncbi:MAG: hypothetical protein MK193_01740 [Lentisphaeria bacterium]|nr:hypothetical protein [Lentisphaeria bacterium]
MKILKLILLGVFIFSGSLFLMKVMVDRKFTTQKSDLDREVYDLKKENKFLQNQKVYKVDLTELKERKSLVEKSLKNYQDGRDQKQVNRNSQAEIHQLIATIREQAQQHQIQLSKSKNLFSQNTPKIILNFTTNFQSFYDFIHALHDLDKTIVLSSLIINKNSKIQLLDIVLEVEF